MPTIDIIVLRRSDDYRAFPADNECLWESGRTAVEAVGKLMYTAQTSFGIAIIEDAPKRAKKRAKGKR
jgi:hypothetical protein